MEQTLLQLAVVEKNRQHCISVTVQFVLLARLIDESHIVECSGAYAYGASGKGTAVPFFWSCRQ